MKPSTSIEATNTGLRWKVVVDGQTVASDNAQSLEKAQAAADEYVARIAKEPTAGP